MPPSRAARRRSAQTAQARPSQAGAAALRDAARAAAAARRAATRAAPRRADRVRTATGTASSSRPSCPSPGPTATRPRSRRPRRRPERKPAPAAAAPAPAAGQAVRARAAKPVAPPRRSQLDALRKQVEQAFADAQAIAADGTRDSLALATSMLDRTLGPLRTAINARARDARDVACRPRSPRPRRATQPTTTNVLAPVEQVLTGMESLLQQLLGGR